MTPAKERRIRRQTAERLLLQFLQRVDDVNRSCHFAFFVEKVYLFGSYLGPRDTLGDVDLAFTMLRKTLGQVRARSAQIAKKQGRQCSESELYQLSLEEVTDYLRAGSRWFEFAAIETLKRQNFPCRLIYTLPGSNALIAAMRLDDERKDVSHLQAIYEAKERQTQEIPRAMRMVRRLSGAGRSATQRGEPR